MAKADILFDKTEFVLRMVEKQAMTMNIKAENIQTVTFQPTMERKLFKKYESEVMIIKMSGGMPGPGGGANGMPIVKSAFENKEKGSWDKMKKNMLNFVKKNNITLHEEKEMWTPPTMGSEG